jgi:outer membrane protein insertion porin family
VWARGPKPVRRAVFLIAVMLLCGWTGRASDLGDFIGRRIVKVEVALEGATGNPNAEVMSSLEVAVGQEYSPIRIHDSLIRLHQSGLAAGARVEATAVGSDGVSLRFLIKPQARIESVLFEGDLGGLSDRELRARLNDLNVGAKLSYGAVARGTGELSSYYSSQGFYKSQITSDVRLDESGTRATVAYAIAPGPRALVSRFTILQKGAPLDLNKVKHVLVEEKPFVEDAVDEEVDHIRSAYLEQDYLAVDIRSNVAADLIDNSVAVTLTIESGPRVAVLIQGLDIPDKKVREILPFYKQGGIDDFTIEDSRLRIEDYAQREGYFFADVIKPDVPDLKGENVRLVYTVETGKRYRLTNIEIEGLDAIPHQTLEDEMKSKTASFVPLFGLGRGVTSSDMLRQDENLIKKRLRELGYRRAKVETRRGVSLKGEDLIVTFDVDQGPRTVIDEVDLRGNIVLSAAELTERVSLGPGDVLTAAAVTANTDRILTAYTSRGFASVEVSPDVYETGSVDGTDRVRLVLSVTENARAHIRSVKTVLTGSTGPRTDEGRLAKDFYEFRAGDWLRLEQLQETERTLYDTNAFNSVLISSDAVAQTANGIEERDITVTLSEAKRFDTIFGFGYQSSKSDLTVPGLGFMSGVKLLTQITHTNFLGKLYTLSAQVRAGRDELLGRIAFQDPRPFGLNYPTQFSVFAQRLAERTFLSDRYTAQVQVERRFSPDTILYISYNFERISIYDLQGSIAEIERNSRPIILGRIGPSYARDKRDNVFDPRGGNLTLASFSVASTKLGGDQDFIKMLVEHSRYYAIDRFRDTVFAVSARLGVATPFGRSDELPISERFFAGGVRDLRGFGFEEAGPHEVAETSPGVFQSVPIGGNALVVINNELHFPIYRIIGGTVFADTGNVFARVRDIKFSDFTQTLGFGIRVKSPIGPVRVDLGFLVFNRPPDAPQGRFHFSVGPTF